MVSHHGHSDVTSFQSTGISLSVKRETVCTVHFFYMKCSFEAVRDLNTEINRFGFVLCYYEILGIEFVAQRLKQLGCSPFKNPACTSTGFKTI